MGCFAGRKVQITQEFQGGCIKEKERKERRRPQRAKKRRLVPVRRRRSRLKKVRDSPCLLSPRNYSGCSQLECRVSRTLRGNMDACFDLLVLIVYALPLVVCPDTGLN